MSKLEIISDGGKVEYYFESTGTIDPIRLNDHDDVGEKFVDGHCWNGKDSFNFNGDPMNFVVQDGYEHMTVRLDGTEVFPSHLKMSVATIESVDGDLACYGIESSGKMIRTNKHGASINGNERRQDDTEWEGQVRGGKDAYAFKGGLSTFWCNQDCYLTVNGVKRKIEGSPPEGN